MPAVYASIPDGSARHWRPPPPRRTRRESLSRAGRRLARQRDERASAKIFAGTRCATRDLRPDLLSERLTNRAVAVNARVANA
jgi:hypothetical protein